MKRKPSTILAAGAAQKVATTGSSRLAVLALLFLASLTYVIHGGSFAIKASPIAEAHASITTVAVIP